VLESRLSTWYFAVRWVPLTPVSIKERKNKMPIENAAKPDYLNLVGTPATVSFLAMEYYAIIMNRTFAISATKTMISGAKAFGAVGSPRSGLGIYRWRDPRNFIGRKTLDKYKGVNPESPDFPAISKENFQINTVDVLGITFNPKQKLSMGGIPHSGSITLSLKDQKPREFILLGDQDGKEIESKLRSICPNAK
jgi:hypothetical protein